MEANFLNYIKFRDCIEKNGCIKIPESFNWAKSIIDKLPEISINLPCIEKKSKILIILDKKNPIYVQLEDGTKLFFTLDEFRRIKGRPQVGKTMALKMQRLPNDNSLYPSKISDCQII